MEEFLNSGPIILSWFSEGQFSLCLAIIIPSILVFAMRCSVKDKEPEMFPVFVVVSTLFVLLLFAVVEGIIRLGSYIYSTW